MLGDTLPSLKVKLKIAHVECLYPQVTKVQVCRGFVIYIFLLSYGSYLYVSVLDKFGHLWWWRWLFLGLIAICKIVLLCLQSQYLHCDYYSHAFKNFMCVTHCVSMAKVARISTKQKLKKSQKLIFGLFIYNHSQSVEDCFIGCIFRKTSIIKRFFSIKSLVCLQTEGLPTTKYQNQQYFHFKCKPKYAHWIFFMWTKWIF